MKEREKERWKMCIGLQEEEGGRGREKVNGGEGSTKGNRLKKGDKNGKKGRERGASLCWREVDGERNEER